MAENNQIFDDLVNNGEKVLQTEHDMYKELLEFERTQVSESAQIERRIIDFLPAEETIHLSNKSTLRLAAESSDMKVSGSMNKSGFLLSTDGTFALKYSTVENKVLRLNLLSESIVSPEEYILYSKKLNRYFISNVKGDFLIGQYANINLADFDFKAILSIDKLILIRKDNLYTVLPRGTSNPEILAADNSFLRIKVHSASNFSAVALSTSITKDFVKFNNGIIEIPVILLEDKSLLYIY